AKSETDDHCLYSVCPAARSSFLTATPEEVAEHPISHTRRYFKQVLEQQSPLNPRTRTFRCC
ncbi:MAG: hypothetical protein FJ070_07770, partial [Cyanobacteria bacterium K_DeepCast_150m_m2_101]|nr:hypothetical protein [Cyanobacteria bacterium K_DeepCast_150m_m2_101]